MSRIMKIVLIALALVVVCAALVFALVGVGKKSVAISPDSAVAVVNGEIITRYQFDSELRTMTERAAMEGQVLDDGTIEELKEITLERLIGIELLWQKSVAHGLVISDEVLEENLAGYMQQFASADVFKAVMERMGLSEEGLRQHIRQRLSVAAFLDREVFRKITVTDEEVSAFYRDSPEYFIEPEQVQASHILVRVKEDAPEEERMAAKQTMLAIEERLRRGENFVRIAQEESDCPSGADGGNLGFFGRGEMDESFERAVFALEPGELSPVVETRFGYHIIKLVERTPEQIMHLDEVQDSVRHYLENLKGESLVDEYLEVLKKNASIERML